MKLGFIKRELYHDCKIKTVRSLIPQEDRRVIVSQFAKRNDNIQVCWLCQLSMKFAFFTSKTRLEIGKVEFLEL